MISFKVNDRTFCVDVDENNIECIILFGSYVIGEYDEKSDLDFMFIIDDCPNYIKEKYRAMIAMQMDIPIHWVSIFTKGSFARRCKSPNTFIWGLKVYGKLIYSRTAYIDAVFNNMSPYLNVNKILFEEQDLVRKNMSKYMRDELSQGDMVFTLCHYIRDLCITINYLYGMFDISKYESVRKCLKIDNVHIPFTFDEYYEFFEIKRDMEAGISKYNKKKIPKAYLIEWYKKFNQLASEVYKQSDRVRHRYFISPLEKYVD